jgi:hypothetical protein
MSESSGWGTSRSVARSIGVSRTITGESSLGLGESLQISQAESAGDGKYCLYGALVPADEVVLKSGKLEWRGQSFTYFEGRDGDSA